MPRVAAGCEACSKTEFTGEPFSIPAVTTASVLPPRDDWIGTAATELDPS
jgi:hypothetical protein